MLFYYVKIKGGMGFQWGGGGGWTLMKLGAEHPEKTLPLKGI